MTMQRKQTLSIESLKFQIWNDYSVFNYEIKPLLAFYILISFKTKYVLEIPIL